MRENGQGSTKLLAILGVITLAVLLVHHWIGHDVPVQEEGGRTAASFWRGVGQDPPYLERFRLLDMSDRPVTQVVVKIRTEEADPAWLDTGLGLGEQPLPPRMSWVPLANPAPGVVVAVWVEVHLDGMEDPYVKIVEGIRENPGDPESDVGAQDTDVTAVIVGRDGVYELYVGVIHAVDPNQARGHHLCTYSP